MKEYFDLQELVCPDVFHKYGQVSWTWFDAKLFAVILSIRQRLNKPIYVNNWQINGNQSQSGFRCIQCEIVKQAIAENRLYVSAHMTGQALDFSVEGLIAQEVRDYIIKNKNIWPYPIRLEDKVSWVHLDARNDGSENKVILFNK
jgi:hypothetical protein